MLFLFFSSNTSVSLFVLMLYVLVNNPSVMLGCVPVFLGNQGWTSTKQRIKRLAQGQGTVPPVSVELSPFRSQV